MSMLTICKAAIAGSNIMKLLLVPVSGSISFLPGNITFERFLLLHSMIFNAMGTENCEVWQSQGLVT